MADFPESLVGTKVVHNFPPAGPIPNRPTPGDIHTLDGEVSTLTFEDSLRKATRNVGPKPLTAKWLEYVPTYVTICKIGNEGILTGPFSGCWFIRFIKESVLYAAHIGTNLSKSESLKVKQAFLTYARRTGISIVSCFNPARTYKSKELISLNRDAQKTYMLGYMIGGDTCFSILLQYDKWEEQPRRHTVVGVRKVECQTWHEVRTTEFPDFKQYTALMQDFKIPVHVPKSIEVKASATTRNRFWKR